MANQHALVWKLGMLDTNGSQRGGRPLVLLLPRRFELIEVLEGEAWKPVTGDEFILLPNPGAETAPPEKIVIRFRGKQRSFVRHPTISCNLHLTIRQEPV